MHEALWNFMPLQKLWKKREAIKFKLICKMKINFPIIMTFNSGDHLLFINIEYLFINIEYRYTVYMVIFAPWLFSPFYNFKRLRPVLNSSRCSFKIKRRRILPCIKYTFLEKHPCAIFLYRLRGYNNCLLSLEVTAYRHVTSFLFLCNIIITISAMILNKIYAWVFIHILRRWKHFYWTLSTLHAVKEKIFFVASCRRVNEAIFNRNKKHLKT